MKKDKSDNMLAITNENLVLLFRYSFEDETGIQLDFRKHQYLENSYGLTPVFNYSFATTVVDGLYRWANAFIDEHQENLVITGIDYNTSMSCEALRASKLKTEIEKVCSLITSSWKQ